MTANKGKQPAPSVRLRVSITPWDSQSSTSFAITTCTDHWRPSVWCVVYETHTLCKLPILIGASCGETNGAIPISLAVYTANQRLSNRQRKVVKHGIGGNPKNTYHSFWSCKQNVT